MIAVYDSGLGGLTALREARRLLPGEDFMYFGDTARIPYGTRSAEIIRAYARQSLDFLAGFSPEAVLIACGTVSSVALPMLKERYPFPLYGVLQPAVRAACAATRNRRVGVIGTQATVSCGRFRAELEEKRPDLSVFQAACPLFVSLAEEGWTAPDDPVASAAARRYLDCFLQAGTDTLILGCTHFPLLSGVIRRILPGVTLIDSGACAARDLAAALPGPASGRGTLSCYVSDAPEHFARLAERFLNEPLPRPTLALSRSAL